MSEQTNKDDCEHEDWTGEEIEGVSLHYRLFLQKCVTCGKVRKRKQPESEYTDWEKVEDIADEDEKAFWVKRGY